MQKNYLKYLKLLIIVSSCTLFSSQLMAQGFKTNIQSTLTTGKNNGSNETYTGIWLNSKKNIGLTRHSLVSLKGKFGGQFYKDDTSPDITDLELQASYLYQPSSGYFSPLYLAKLKYKTENFSGVSENKNKTSISFFRSQPISNQIEFAIGYKFEQEDGIVSIDSHHLTFNADYNYSIKNLFYFNVNFSDEDLTASSSSADIDSDFTARPLDSSGGHLPGEAGHHIDTDVGSSNNVFSSNNSSISIGTIYSLSEKHSFDIAFIKHFYKVTNDDTHATTKSNSSYFAIDYFYHF